MNVVILPVLVPLVAGLLLLAAPTRAVRAWLALAAGAANLAASLAVAARATAGEVLVSALGGWPAPYGIALVADGLSGVMVALSGLVALATVAYSVASIDAERERFGHHALLQFLVTGVNMSFLTGDLFNLFVAFEVMLVASYALAVHGSSRAQLREGFRYVVINLLASALFVVGAGLVYGVMGTLNMAQLAERSLALGPNPTVTALALLLAVVFATKTALFPLAFWLPGTYPTPPPAVSAFFGAMLTKVGVYALVRLLATVFTAEPAVTQPLVLTAAGISMLAGGLGALTQARWRHILSFSNVGQIGYLAMGLGLMSVASLAATIYYLVHHVLVKFALFLLAGVAERAAGRDDVHVGGALGRAPWLAGGFLFSAVALAGLPPTSGFIAKFALVRAALEAGGTLAVLVAVVAVLASLLSLYAMLTVWRGYFWGVPGGPLVAVPTGMSVTAGLAVAALVAVVVLAGPLYELSSTVAAQLADPSRYIEAVLR